AGDPDALANWISLSQDSLTVPSGRTMEIGFSIYIPKTASPGGHYAAVMIGTKPAGRSMQGAAVSVGSFVTSLVFMNVKGEAKTGGIITKFSTDRAVYDLPDAKFSLMFQNTGNVYVRPEGGISIYNMWGVKQASIPVNQGTSFGTVLPSSSREFDAEWKGADDFFGIGRYTAVASVAYGSLPGQTVSSTLSFWIFPAGRAAAVLGGMLFFFFVIVFSAKLYVRRALALRPLRRSRMDAVPAAASRETGFDRILLGPIAEGVLDLRKAREASRSVPRPPRNYFWRRWSLFGPLLRKYVAFLVLFPLCILAVLWIAAYLRAAFNTEKTYDITVQVSAGSVAPGGNANTVQ
ncbi:MAG TPA: hypothetical protein VNG29_04010, partial [Candidatus Paceibacterota bacterium]|nr:hypothetical protein [Candidatus Paceibacterota bacterium]